jgi:pSer/pThr/pTyr-binding forkhead associated (FHA) protein
MCAEFEQKGVAGIETSLKILAGPSSGQTMPISAGTLVIGREDNCDFQSRSRYISRHHCLLLRDEYTLRVHDLGSKNGTFVNGHRITYGETILLPGDIVSLGDLEFEIVLEPATLESPCAALDGSIVALEGQPVH